MTSNPHLAEKACHGGYVVRSPRATDALGHALRGVFVETPLPTDLVMLLDRLNRVMH